MNQYENESMYPESIQSQQDDDNTTVNASQIFHHMVNNTSKIFIKSGKQAEVSQELNKEIKSVGQYDMSSQYRNQLIPHYRIVFVGKTGCGKSTLINLIFNVLLKLDYTDERYMAINVKVGGKTLPCNIPFFKTRQSDSSQSTESQTQKVNFYSLKGKDKKVTLIDTPGLLDTKGVEIDSQHIRKIVASVQKLESINAICYVHKGSDDKKEVSLKYQVNELQGMLPKEFKQNFFVCFTYRNGAQITAQVLLEELQLLTKDNYINLNNSCFTPLSHLQLQGDDYKEELTIQNQNWNNAKKEINRLFEKIQTVGPNKPQGIMELHINKECIKRVIQNKAVVIREINDLKFQLQRDQKKLEKKKQELKQNTNLKTEIEKSRIIKVKKIRKTYENVDISPSKITQCLICFSNCHNPCYLDGIYLKGSVEMQNCWCIIKETKCCKVCKCEAIYHRHTQFKKEELPKEFDDDQIEFYYEQSSDITEISRQDSLITTIEQYNQIIKSKESQIKLKNDQLDLQIRYIAYMHKKIIDTALVSGNPNLLLQYLDSCKQHLQSLPAQEDQLAGINELIKDVRVQKLEYDQAISKAGVVTDQERQSIENEIMVECETIKYLAEQEIQLKQEENYPREKILGKNGEEFEVS